jgi:hypothetical protein
MKFCLDGDPSNKWFAFNKRKKSKYEMDYILDKNNIDPNDYYIIKGTANFRLVNIDGISKYACVLWLNKDKYSLDHINLWIDFITKLGIIKFLTIPFPPEYILNKIKVIQ